jgi:hypothetical protein
MAGDDPVDGRENLPIRKANHKQGMTARKFSDFLVLSIINEMRCVTYKDTVCWDCDTQ